MWTVGQRLQVVEQSEQPGSGPPIWAADPRVAHDRLRFCCVRRIADCFELPLIMFSDSVHQVHTNATVREEASPVAARAFLLQTHCLPRLQPMVCDTCIRPRSPCSITLCLQTGNCYTAPGYMWPSSQSIRTWSISLITRLNSAAQPQAKRP